MFPQWIVLQSLLATSRMRNAAQNDQKQRLAQSMCSGRFQAQYHHHQELGTELYRCVGRVT